jgi:hypothetical protein
MLDGERYGHMHMCGDAHACMHGLILVVPFGRTVWSYYPLVVLPFGRTGASTGYDRYDASRGPRTVR